MLAFQFSFKSLVFVSCVEAVYKTSIFFIIGKGLTKYTSDPSVLKGLLTSCLKKAEKDIPESKRGSVPLNMEATAGMRMLKYAED